MNQEAAALQNSLSAQHAVVNSPEYFLHSINPAAETLQFVKTSRQQLSSHSFLDGRSAFSLAEKPISIPLELALTLVDNASSVPFPNRYVFHMAFCGSTLISRVFDQPGQCVTYKEPNILLQLAELKAANADIFVQKARWLALVNFVLWKFRQPWQAGEAVIIKPSNWLNSMLPQLVEDGGDSRFMMLGLSPLAFLVAVFRGGGERIKFAHRVLKHLLWSFPEFTSLVDKTEREALTIPNQFARLVLVLHAIQCKAFERITRISQPAQTILFDYQSVLSAPDKQIRLMVDALDLQLTSEQISDSIDRVFNKHSKINNRNYDPLAAREVDRQVLNEYQQDFSAALSWADRELTHLRSL